MEPLTSNNILFAAIIASLAGLTWYVLYLPGMIFGFIGESAKKHLPEKVQKPLFTCPVCMTFWYGLFTHAFILETELHIAFFGSLLGIGLSALVVGLFKDDE